MNQNDKIKVLHVSIGLSTGGLERVITILTTRMDKNLFSVGSLCLKYVGEFGEYLRKNGYTVETFPQNPNRFDIRDPWRLSRYLKKRNVDVVHAHSGAFFMSVAAARLAGIPAVFYTDHGRPQIEGTKRVIEEAVTARFVDRVVAVSKELKQHLITKTHFPAGKIDVIVNGIDTDVFRPRPKPQELLVEFRLPEKAKIVGSTGRFSREKGYHVLIDSFRQVIDRIPYTFLLLVGDGPQRKDLEKQSEATGCKNRIIFTGVRNDIPELLNIFDIFVLPSIYEGTSMSLLEAMASAKPPVATRVGGNLSIINHQESGLLVPSENPAALAEAIIELLSDAGKRAAFGKAAEKKIKTEYSQENMVRKYSELYLSVLQKKKRFLDTRPPWSN